jgi:hypothetical protein
MKNYFIACAFIVFANAQLNAISNPFNSTLWHDTTGRIKQACLNNPKAVAAGLIGTTSFLALSAKHGSTISATKELQQACLDNPKAIIAGGVGIASILAITQMGVTFAAQKKSEQTQPEQIENSPTLSINNQGQWDQYAKEMQSFNFKTKMAQSLLACAVGYGAYQYWKKSA